MRSGPGEAEGLVEDGAERLVASYESRHDEGVEEGGEADAFEETREGGVPVADDEEAIAPALQLVEDAGYVREDLPVALVLEVEDELQEELVRHLVPPEAAERILHEAAPEAPLTAVSAPPLEPPRAAFGHVGPRRLQGGPHVGGRGRDAVAREGLRVNALYGRVGGQEGIPGVEEDRAKAQGITWPPSMTIACPVMFDASSEARYAARPATSSGIRAFPSGAIRAAIAKASSSETPVDLATRRTP